MKKYIAALLLTFLFAIPAMAEEYDLAAKDPQVLSQIKLKGMTRKELRKAYRTLLQTYTELYNVYNEIEPDAAADPQQEAETVMIDVYTASASLNIRKAPSTDSEILGRFDPGAVVDVVSIEDGWAQINYQDGTAYVSAQYIAQTSVPAEAAAPADGSGILIPGSSADFAGRFSWDVIDALRHAGFTSIEEISEETVLSEDLPFGLLTETGDVKEVRADGKTDYARGDRFPADTPITVVAYSITTEEAKSDSQQEEPAAEEAMTE